MLEQESHSARLAKLRNAFLELGCGPLLERVMGETGRIPLFSLVHLRSKLYPDELAFSEAVDGELGRHVSNEEVASAIQANAAELRRRGVGQGSPVIVGYENSIDHALAVLSVWAIGGRVVLAPPNSPGPAIDGLAVSTGAVLSIGTESRPEFGLLSGDSNEELDRSAIFGLDAGRVSVQTGGTTRSPRLIALSEPVWAYVGDDGPGFADLHGMWRFDRQLVMLPLFHGFAFTFCYNFGLALGHQICFARPSERSNFTRIVSTERIQYAALVPSQMRRIDLQPSDRVNLESLRCVLHSASRCPPDLKRKWIEILGPERVLEAYGATDAPIACVISGTAWLERPGSVGKPAFGRVHILDANSARLPPGAEGRIVVAPNALGMKVTADTSRAGPQAGFTDTGDTGSIDRDGYLFVSGRADSSVDIGGVLVDLEEIEDELVMIDGVADVRVLFRSEAHRSWIEALVELTPVSSIECVRAAAEVRLTGERLPASIRSVASVGRTETGKIVRHTQASSPASYRL